MGGANLEGTNIYTSPIGSTFGEGSNLKATGIISCLCLDAPILFARFFHGGPVGDLSTGSHGAGLFARCFYGWGGCLTGGV